MPSLRPPTIASAAADRWERIAPAQSPWLHEEVGRRMAERLQWIRLAPQAWCHWEPVRGGLALHETIASHYPQARCQVVEPQPARAAAARAALARPWWKRIGAAPFDVVAEPSAAGAQMLWANMLLHMAADPEQLLQRWQRALAVDGFLMFSCLGPDSLRELRRLYAALDWPPCAHEFTDMHDWGDMLVAGGFAEPVMDMEHITLTFDTPERLLQELAGLGRNLHVARFAGLRSPAWRARLLQAIDRQLRGADGRLALTFEIVYGHALKAAPRLKMDGQSTLAVDDLRAMLQSGRRR